MTSSTPTDPVIVGPQKYGDGFTFYESITVVVTTSIAADIAVGTLVKLAGSSAANCDTATGVPVIAVLSTTSFKISYHSQDGTAGTGGTAVVQAPSMVRQNNIVTATTAAPHGFQVGFQVNVLNAGAAIGGGISAISRDGNGVVTVTTTDPHGLPIGALVQILGVTNPDASFNTSYVGVPVASVLSPTSFTYQQGGTAEASSAGTGDVYDVWDGTFFVQSVPSPTTFTYENIGPNDQTNASGTATVVGQLSPGAHGIVQMFLTRQGAITKPSPPVIFYANGGQQALVSNLAIGPPNVVARLIGATGAGGDNYFTIPATPQVGGTITGTWLVIPDNSSTSAVIDFSDNTLFAGIAIDQIGNDLFDQRLLIAPVGFFSYSSRLFPWGDYNSIQNLLNLTFGGGIDYQQVTNLATSGTQSSGGAAWSNPSYITDTGTSNYATATATGGGASVTQQLLAEDYGFAAAGEIGASISAIFNYYYVNTGLGINRLNVQLLKAGVPVGAAKSIFLAGGSGGISTAPLTANLTFANPGLTGTDVDDANFGFAITASCPGGAGNALAIAVNSGYVAISEQTNPSAWSTSGTTSDTGGVVPASLPGISQLYEMVSAGGTNDCMLSQSAYQDAFGTAILLPNTKYKIRLYAVQSGNPAAGNLILDFYSPTLGQLAAASIPAAGLPVDGANGGFTMANFNLATPATIPPDTLFRVYLSSVTAAAVVSVGEIAPIYAATPYAGNTAFASYVLNPEGIAQTTGLIGSADDPSPVMCFSIQRNVSLLKSYAGTHTFQDNGDEPYTWTVNNLSRSVGACSIRAGDPGQFGTGDAAEDWDVTVNQNGMYLFAGGDFWKISQELDLGDPSNPVPTWQNINWTAEQTIWTKNDPRTHRIYIGAPIYGATQPNIVWVLDYKELDTGTDLSNGPSLKIGLTGKMLSTDKTRKWSRWNIAANSADILIRPGNEKEMTFAGGAKNGAAYGNIYTLDPTKLTDDDYGQISPYYSTYFFVNHELEQVLQLGTGRKLMRKITAFITGVGYVSIIPFVNSLQNPLPATSVRALAADSDPSNLANQDLEWTTAIRGNRICLRIQVEPLPGATDVQLKIQKIIAYMMKDPVIYHRSSAV